MESGVFSIKNYEMMWKQLINALNDIAVEDIVYVQDLKRLMVDIELDESNQLLKPMNLSVCSRTN